MSKVLNNYAYDPKYEFHGSGSRNIGRNFDRHKYMNFGIIQSFLFSKISY